jgi:hypothetical protein
LTDIANIRRRRQPSSSATSFESNNIDLESCFDTSDELGSTDSDTNPIDYDSGIEGFNNVDGMIIDEDEGKDHPPEYYLNQEDEFDESEYLAEDYSNGNCLLLDYIEERFSQ